jgi:hypothetical protein
MNMFSSWSGSFHFSKQFHIFAKPKLQSVLMKNLFFAFVAISATYISFSQSKDTTVLIIPCKSGELLIDGISKGKVDADDAHREQLPFGDHYFQLKTQKERINNTIRIDNSLTSNIIKLGCDERNPNGIRLIDKQLSLGGALDSDLEDNYFGLDNGDELSVECSVLNKKGNATLSIVQYESGTEIYRKEKFNVIENESIKVPRKGIYKVLLYTDALFGKDAKLVVERIPSKNSSPDFKTTIHVVSDTTSSEVLNTTVRVFSMTNLDHSNKTVVRVNLPNNTTYWTYWVGVGQASKDKMKQFVSGLSGIGNLLSADPLFLFGMKLIPSLPMLNATSTINYRFMNAQNAQWFAAGNNYNYYTFKYANNVATDYAFINQGLKDLSLCLWNESSLTGQDVELRVRAFSVRRWFEMDSQ